MVSPSNHEPFTLDKLRLSGVGWYPAHAMGKADQEGVMGETIRETYLRKNPRSAALYSEFRQVFPSGVSHDLRATDPFPIVIERGQGSRKWDVYGNEYIDFGMGSASLLLGHAHPAVVEALVKAAPGGSHHGNPVESEPEWGQRVCDLVPCADKVRFVASGAEATMLAMRVARGHTGKDKIVRLGVPLPRMARLCDAWDPSTV